MCCYRLFIQDTSRKLIIEWVSGNFTVLWLFLLDTLRYSFITVVFVCIIRFWWRINSLFCIEKDNGEWPDGELIRKSAVSLSPPPPISTWSHLRCYVGARVILIKSSSAIAKRPRDASCLSVVSFVASIVHIERSFFIISYFSFGFTSAYNLILFCCLRRNVKPCCHTHDM